MRPLPGWCPDQRCLVLSLAFTIVFAELICAVCLRTRLSYGGLTVGHLRIGRVPGQRCGLDAGVLERRAGEQVIKDDPDACGPVGCAAGDGSPREW